MRLVRSILLLLTTAALQSATAARLLQAEACSALTSTSLQFKGNKLGSASVSAYGDGCCEACAKMPACQMWWAKGGVCEMYSLDKVGARLQNRSQAVEYAPSKLPGPSYCTSHWCLIRAVCTQCRQACMLAHSFQLFCLQLTSSSTSCAPLMMSRAEDTAALLRSVLAAVLPYACLLVLPGSCDLEHHVPDQSRRHELRPLSSCGKVRRL